MTISKIKIVSTIVFGLLVPLSLLIQAYVAMTYLGDVIQESSGYPLIKQMQGLQPQLRTPDDYRLVSQVLAESANQRTMINKQAMKISAMNVGFATISLGIMLILLGVKGEEQMSATVLSATIDFRKVSTGALIFSVGAAITSAAALLPNQYSTVGMPAFSGSPVVPVELTDEQICARTFDGDPSMLKQCLEEAGNVHTIQKVK